MSPGCSGDAVRRPGQPGGFPAAPGLLLLVVTALLLFFTDLHRPGFQMNEGRYAEVAREMVLTGDWITPHVNGQVYLNKPPLTFWLIALVFRVSGPSGSYSIRP